MTRKRRWIEITLLFVLSYAAYKWHYPSYSWRQKLTIQIETPDGIVGGSGVVAGGLSRLPKMLPDAQSSKSWIRGEALAIILPDGRYLFAPPRLPSGMGCEYSLLS